MDLTPYPQPGTNDVVLPTGPAPVVVPPVSYPCSLPRPHKKLTTILCTVRLVAPHEQHLSKVLVLEENAPCSSWLVALEDCGWQ